MLPCQDVSSQEGSDRFVLFSRKPGVCNQAFSMFNCRDLDGGLSVLHKDYSIKCSTDQHAAFELIAAAYVVCVSLGIPLYMVRSTKCLRLFYNISQSVTLGPWAGATHGAADEGLRRGERLRAVRGAAGGGRAEAGRPGGGRRDSGRHHWTRVQLPGERIQTEILLLGRCPLP